LLLKYRLLHLGELVLVHHHTTTRLMTLQLSCLGLGRAFSSDCGDLLTCKFAYFYFISVSDAET
jgi:hypothetical protein